MARKQKIETKGNTTGIVNQNEQVQKYPANIIEEYFKNSRIDNCIINIFNDVKDGKRESFTIEHKYTNKRIEFKESDHDSMSEFVVDGQSTTSKTEKQEPINVNLLLRKPDLLGDSAWQFAYNKNTLAKMEDKEFLDKVHTRKIKHCMLV